MSTPTIIAATPPERHRFHLLDALRGIAAIIVADVHTSALIGNIAFARNGYLAVDFFFCLSGFVIAFSYERRLFEGLTIGSFFTARMIRLYPMLFFAMTIGVLKPLLLQVHRSDFHILREKALFYVQAIFLLPNLSSRREIMVFPLDNAAWSLFFELVANLAFAFVAFRRRTPAWLLVLVFAISFCLLALGSHAHVPFISMGSESAPTRFLLGLPRVALSFVSGVLVLRLYHRWEAASRSRTLGTGTAIAVTAVLLFVLLSPLHWMEATIFQFLAIAFAMPCLVFTGAMARIPAALHTLASVLGELSYPMYLLHIVLNYAFASVAIKFIARWPDVHPFALSVIIAADILIAFAFAKWIDLPVRKFALRRYNAFTSSKQLSA